MKRKFILGLGAISTLAAIPTIAATCGVSSPAKVAKARAAYEDAFKKFNYAVESDVKALVEKKKAINAKDISKEQKQKLIAEKDAWVKTRTPILQDLRKKANDEFKNLKKVQKNFKTQVVKIVHTNDEHGRLVFDDGKFNNYSGMQGLAEILNKDFDRDLLLSAGDLIQGLPLSDSDKGLTISKVAKEMNYQAVAIGNHEFDYGLEHMFNIERETAGMPFLSANIVWNEKAVSEKIKTKDGKLAVKDEKVFTPYIIKTLDSGIKVGIMGITTPDTQWTSNPKNSVHVTFLDPIESGKKTVEELKSKGVNFIVALTHLGVNRPDTRWDSREFTKNVEGVDLVLDGHSHTRVDIERKDEEKGFLTQAECYTRYLSELDLVVDSETGKVSEVKQHLRTIEYTELLGGKENSIQSIKDMIGKLKEKFDAVNDKVVFKSSVEFKHTEEVKIKPGGGEREIPIWRGRAQQTNLGTFAADAAVYDFIENKPKVNGQEVQFSDDNVIGLVNGGGLRQDTQSGDIKRADLLGISPFGNRIAAVQVKGSVLLEAMKHGASKVFSGAYAQYSHNVKANINFKETKGDKFVYELDENSVKINDKAVDKNKDYYIVTNDFILIGGDGYEMLDYVKHPEKAKSVFEGGDILESYIKFGQLITNKEASKESTNPFGKRKIENYKDIEQKNIEVKHTK
ncbi:5'-nucleotidase C-terminal domain-containing protein [Mycoplasmopsis agalactiae]|uniref:5'-nucleotidase C-terminal domain-containing protein n=1 Tax=Mycoplasmopsis agalactiae TaxID=2110 RepID=UPI001455DF61|nr:5'-nucleotidase C-terminal domain-containing protein [Mycoplasmopsis agalactiae]MCE6057321.1 5'-nucleotidase C-terminal domain-containing protein [Mycoplasmopsis agalactiae]MCE6057322.1 5'-nucleotidase C-terminal domain-containing protein [Mycoplasmopsis agalactiae]MCE6079105.1 5'-nucleotidase C-terminal domain-containing protein [Mycoplasmopsis agalactiae]MCE6095493.1 5'-nucleotidase C-terminal domain-containing protein [Mycoplasmopsis agalactiae]MCE6114747.1 5'-nucleotidase C-terminal dom